METNGMSLKRGDRVFVFNKKWKPIERVVCMVFPHHVATELLPGEITSDPKTGMFISDKHYLKLEVGRTVAELIENRRFLEFERICHYEKKISKSRKKLKNLKKLKKANSSL